MDQAADHQSHFPNIRSCKACIVHVPETTVESQTGSDQGFQKRISSGYHSRCIICLLDRTGKSIHCIIARRKLHAC